MRETIASLKEIDPDHVVPMHCTGEPFWEIAKAEMPSKLLRAYTGTRFVFEPCILHSSGSAGAPHAVGVAARPPRAAPRLLSPHRREA